MKKTIIVAILVLLAVIIGVGVFLYNSIDSIVKGAIEKYGTDIAGTKVTVGSVDISLKSGRGTIRHLVVRNPKGFSSGAAFELDEVTVDIDVASLNKDPIVIDEVTVKAPVVSGEMLADGKTNLGAIRDHADQYRTGQSTSGKKGDGYEKKFRIEKFVFEEGRVKADAKAVGVEEPIDAALPAIRMNDVGGANGSPPDVIAKEITRELLDTATRVATREAAERSGIIDRTKKAIGDIIK